MKLPKMLNDKNVLYIVFFIAILNILGYLMTSNFESVVFFLIIGFLSTYFSKNMIIVLIISIISTSIFASTRSSKIFNTYYEGDGKVYYEGMDNMDNENQETKNENIKKAAMVRRHNENNDSDNIQGEPQNQSRVKGKGNRIDYANTLEKAYENLQSTIGKEGIKGLTVQTESLINQQKELMDNINQMTPFIKTAEGFLNNLDLSGLENIGNILSKVTGKKKE